MGSLFILVILISFPTVAIAECYAETGIRCSESELDVRLRSDKYGLPGQPYFNFLKGCAGAAIADSVRCPGEKLRDGIEWTKEKATSALRELGYDTYGRKLDVKSPVEDSLERMRREEETRKLEEILNRERLKLYEKERRLREGSTGGGAGGVSLNLNPVGRETDLSDVRNRVMDLKR